MLARTRRPWYVSGWALFSAAAFLTILEFVIAGRAELNILAVGFLGGIVLGLTNVNDYRITRGRRALNEGSLLGGRTLLASGGLTGAVLTWILLAPFYFFQGARYGQHASFALLASDLAEAFSLKVHIPDLGVDLPGAFGWVGVLTVLYTGGLFRVMEADRTAHGIYGIVIPAAVLLCDILLGAVWLHDPLSGTEVVLVGAMFVAVVCVMVPSGPAQMRESATDAASAPLGFVRLGRIDVPIHLVALLVVTGAVAVDLGIRRSLGFEFEHDLGEGRTHEAMVALCFRALYFSVFFGYAAYWFSRKTHRAAARYEMSSASSARSKWTVCGVVLLTAVLFTITFFLTVPAVASNLALGPLAVTAGSVLSFAVAGAVYGSTGRSTGWRSRVSDTLLAPGRRGRVNSLGYGGLLATLIIWIFRCVGQL